MRRKRLRCSLEWIMLADLIREHALADAQAGNWPAVAATLQAIEITAPARLCYAVESGEAAVAAGGNHTELLGVLLQDPNGIMLFQKLSSSAGVMWAHAVTVPYLQWLVSQERMTEAVKDALIDLSAPVTQPHSDVTAEQCQTAWQAHQLRLLQITFATLADAVRNAIGTSEQTDKIAEMRTMLEAVEAV